LGENYPANGFCRIFEIKIPYQGICRKADSF